MKPRHVCEDPECVVCGSGTDWGKEYSKLDKQCSEQQHTIQAQVATIVSQREREAALVMALNRVEKFARDVAAQYTSEEHEEKLGEEWDLECVADAYEEVILRARATFRPLICDPDLASEGKCPCGGA